MTGTDTVNDSGVSGPICIRPVLSAGIGEAVAPDGESDCGVVDSPPHPANANTLATIPMITDLTVDTAPPLQ
ncbi:MAG: hypothetical protein FWE39_15495, partial [Nocardiaceae bacterium]|nr:hypothetical protein [Nocardiaceae bacterium]